MSPLHIHWFRQDLRLADNPSLYEASSKGTLLPIYILDDANADKHTMGGASRCWLHHSLTSLNESLEGKLSLYKGDAQEILETLLCEHDIASVNWNRCYEPWRMERDSHIKEMLKAKEVEVHSYNGALLWEPWQIKKDDGTHYKVFTPFYRKGCLNAETPREPLPKPSHLKLYHDPQSLSVEELDLLPDIAWDKPLISHWDISEEGAHNRLHHFMENGIRHYKDGRNLPAKPYVSRLSPYLNFGEISPYQAWHAATHSGDDKHVDHFCSELGWREFSYSLLYYYPDLPRSNLQKKFDHFPWVDNAKHLKAWQKGETGIPMVDAGMRELWKTGYMHNRVRMIVGSFLVKNLLLHWHHGEAWFWDCLFDADLANNSASWQWIAGCGADAAPYFRIFNPVTQGKKFDSDGEYVRQYIPELSQLPNQYLFSPWEAPQEALDEAGIRLGKDYPHPIVDLKESREQALKAFESLKKHTS